MKSKGDVWRELLLHIFCLMLVFDIDKCLICLLCIYSLCLLCIYSLALFFIIHIYVLLYNRSCIKDCEVKMCIVYVEAPPFATWTYGSVKVVIIMNIMVIYCQQDVSCVLFLVWKQNLCCFVGKHADEIWNMRICLQSTVYVYCCAAILWHPKMPIGSNAHWPAIFRWGMLLVRWPHQKIYASQKSNKIKTIPLSFPHAPSACISLIINIPSPRHHANDAKAKAVVTWMWSKEQQGRSHILLGQLLPLLKQVQLPPNRVVSFEGTWYDGWGVDNRTNY